MARTTPPFAPPRSHSEAFERNGAPQTRNEAQQLEAEQIESTTSDLQVPYSPCCNLTASHGVGSSSEQCSLQAETQWECKECGLVAYCSLGCMEKHASMHLPDCEAFQAGERRAWQPSYISEGRQRSPGERNEHSQKGQCNYPWGNVPAIDLLQLARNEGEHYNKRINLLLAASGDMRHLVETINSLPESYTQPIDIDMNDYSFYIVARNVIMLLVLFTVEDVELATTSVLHLWYSGSITQKCLDSMDETRILIDEVCAKLDADPNRDTEGRARGHPFSYAHRPGSSRLSVFLRKDHWRRLRAYLDVPLDLDKVESERIRQATMNPPEAQDYLEDCYAQKTIPGWPTFEAKFREDGILLPSGQSREGFVHPNPLMFQMRSPLNGVQTCIWPMGFSDSPMLGWPWRKVFATKTVATNDTSGKLYHYIRCQLHRFHRQLRLRQIRIDLHNRDAATWPPEWSTGRVPKLYDRIESANIADETYIGIKKVLTQLGPYLRPREDNPHATIVTYLMHAISQHMPIQNQDPPGRKAWMEISIRQAGGDKDLYFEQYTNEYQYDSTAKAAGMVRKLSTAHTIVSAWPMDPMLSSNTPEAKHDFKLLLGNSMFSYPHNWIRYVEWKKLE